MLSRTTTIVSVILFVLLNPSVAQVKSQPDTLISLKEFEIKGLTSRNIFQPTDTIGEASISQMTSKDIGDALRGQANISGIKKGGTGIDPVIRGFKYSQLNVQLNEGQKIEGACPNRMDPPTAHIDLDDIRMLEIFKGPYALRFGPNFGGVVHLHTFPENRPDTFKVNLKASTGFESVSPGMKQHLDVSGGNKSFLLKIAANYKKYGDYKDGNGHIVPSSFERYNYNGLLVVNPWQHHEFTLFYDHAIGKNLDFPSLPMDERLDNTNLYSFDYVYKNEGGMLEGIQLKLYQSDVHHEMDNKQRPISDTTVAVSIIDDLNTGYRAEASLAFNKATLHAGSDMEDIRKDGDRVKTFIMQPTAPVKNEKLWDNAHIRNIGFFAEYARLFGKVNTVAAFRLDFNSAASNPLTAENMQGQTVYQQDDVESSFTNFSFSLGTDWYLKKNLTLGLAAGRGVRSPDMTERYIILLPIGYDNYDYLGNPSLKPEQNYQVDFIIKWTIPKAGMIKFNGFYSCVIDFITGQMLPSSEVKPQTKGVYGVKQFINEDKVHLTGFEIEFHTPVSKPWLLEAAAGYTYAVNPLATAYIIENGQVTGTQLIENDPLSEIPPFEGSVRFLWKFFNGKFVPKANIRFVAAQNRISEAYQERESPGFVLVGASLFYRFNEVLQLNAGIDNIFNKAYYEHLNRNMVGTTDNFYEPGRNFYVTLRFVL
jgi:iron complex outermembrane receptor protein